jgi:transcription initiation factor TFIID subunit 1, fungi type
MEEDASFTIRPKGARVRVVKRLIERPKTVYERFPAFEKDKVLNFSELFKGYTGKKSRLGKKPFHCEFSVNLLTAMT